MAFQKPSRCEQATPNNRTHNSTANYVNLALAKDVILTGFKNRSSLLVGRNIANIFHFFCPNPLALACHSLPSVPTGTKLEVSRQTEAQS